MGSDARDGAFALFVASDHAHPRLTASKPNKAQQVF